MNLQAPDVERLRVAEHIQRAERLAHARELDALSPLQRLLRTVLLDELARYRAEGRFPCVEGFALPTPCFVDAHGTRCAMAHLLDLGGASELVDRIASERNHATVYELADEPELLAWLSAAGIAVDEAAVIQPGYCNTPAECLCGSSLESVGYAVPSQGVLEATVNPFTLSDAITATVVAVHGAAPGVAIGQSVQITSSVGEGFAAGAHVLVPVWEGDAGMSLAGRSGHVAVVLARNGTYVCHGRGGDSPPISPSEFARIVGSANCQSAATALGSEWSRLQCSDHVAMGCAASPELPAAPVTTLGVLCAVVSALVVRRARRP